MTIALNNFPLATWGGVPLQEIGPATGNALNADTDCHFGVSGDAAGFNKTSTRGARGIDLALRGGSVAEDFWNEFRADPGGWSDRMNKFMGEFWDFCSASLIDPAKTAFPQGAKMDGIDIGGTPKYSAQPEHRAFPGTDWDRRKDFNNMVTTPPTAPADRGSQSQFGTRWSKGAISITASRNGTVHFHLDGMGDIKDLVEKHGDFAYNVTSRELRFLKRNWATLSSKTILYNGFDNSGRPMRVKAPWN